MIKKDIIETEVRASGFKQVQADIVQTSARIDAHRDKLKDLQHQRTLLIAEGKKDSDQYRNLRKEIDNTTKSIKEETQVLQAHYSKLNLGEMSYTQLSRRAKELSKQLRDTSKAADPERYTKLEQELARVNRQMEKTKVGGKQVASVFQNALSVFAGNMLTKGFEKVKQLVKEGVEWIKEGSKMATLAEGVQDAFNRLNKPGLLSNLRKDTKGTVNDLTLMKAAVRADNFEIPLNDLGKLFKFAQQRAKDTGESVEYLTNSIVDGIGRKSPLILDNLGISVSRLRDKMAETGDMASAAIAIVNEELQKQGDYAINSADKEERAAVRWENAQLRVGQKSKWLRDLWNEVSADMADGVSKLVGETRSAVEVHDDQISKVAELEKNTVPLLSRYDQLSKKTNLSTEEQTELKNIIQKLGETVPSAINGFDEYGRAMDINRDKVEDFIKTQKDLLAYTNLSAIQQTENDIDSYQQKINNLQILLKGGKTFNSFWGMLSATEEDKTRMREDIETYAGMISGAKQRLAGLTGQTLEESVKARQEESDKREEFNQMTKKQLEDWIKSVGDADEKYTSLAKKVFSQRFGGPPVTPTPKSDNNNWNLNSDQSYQEQRLQLKQEYLRGEIATEKEYKAQLLQLEVDSLQDRIDLNKDGADMLQQLNEQLTDKLLEQQKARQENELRINKLIEESQTDLIVKEQQNHQTRLEQYGLAGLQREQMTEEQSTAIEILERQHRRNLDKIENEAITETQKKLDAEFNLRLTRMITRHNDELADVRTLEQAKNLLRETYGIEEVDKIASIGDARKRIQQEQNKEIEAITLEHLQSLKDMLNHLLDGEAFEGLDLSNLVLSEEQKKIIEERLAEIGLKISGLKNQQGGEESEKEDAFSFSGGKADILGLTPEDWELFYQHLEDGKLGIQDMIALATSLNSVFKMYDSFVTASENKQLKQTQKNNDKKKAQFKARLDADRMSQEDYNKAIETMDAEYERQKEEMELKQARRQKAQAIISSLINTAVAVTSALPNIPLSIAVGLLGAIQTGIIAAQPIAGREEGSFLVEREQDGRKFNAEFAPQKRGKIGKPTVIVGENGNEYVIPADGYDNPTLSPIIRTIESARLNGTLRSFDFTNTQPVRLVGQETGGYTGQSIPGNIPTEIDTSNPPQDSALIRQVLIVLDKLNHQLEKPITALVTMLGKGGFVEAWEEYQRTRNKGKIA